MGACVQYEQHVEEDESPVLLVSAVVVSGALVSLLVAVTYVCCWSQARRLSGQTPDRGYRPGEMQYLLTLWDSHYITLTVY